jgi:KaiC/GvpD/RAD55 family RecA-like ATPase
MKINFPPYYNVLLFGPPGVGKFDFILNYTALSLKASEKVVFITTVIPWRT